MLALISSKNAILSILYLFAAPFWNRVDFDYFPWKRVAFLSALRFVEREDESDDTRMAWKILERGFVNQLFQLCFSIYLLFDINYIGFDFEI